MGSTTGIISCVTELLTEVGEDPERPGLRETPKRVAAMYEEVLSGYAVDPHSVLKTFEVEEEASSSLVVIGRVSFWSLCEHHLLPFRGLVDVGIEYAPGHPILGLSKVPRLVDVFARRLQVQERLTHQIADALHTGLKAQGVVVRIRESEHLCMAMRGVCKAGATAATLVKLGSFVDNPDLYQTFLSLC